jgi:hypothetical protein
VTTLLWQPPGLSRDNTQIIRPDNSGFSSRVFTVATGTDVLVVMPSFPLTNLPGSTGCLRINGANNVVIIGGEFQVPTNGGASESQRSAIFLNQITGTIHLEGLLIGSPTQFVSNGVEIYNSPNAVMQIQNSAIYVRAVDPVNFTDGHPDVVFCDNSQNGGYSLGELRTFRLLGDTDYQGLSLLGKGCLGVYRETYIRIVEQGQAGTTQALWKQDATNRVKFQNDVYLEKRASQTFGLSVHPDSTDGTTANRPNVDATNKITWPGVPSFEGYVQGMDAGSAVPIVMPAQLGLGYQAQHNQFVP